MKKQFSFYKLGFVPLIALFCSANAQTKMFNGNLSTSPAKEVVLSEDVPGIESTGSYSSAMNSKALRNFSKSFKEAGNASWSQTEDGFKAEFMDQDVKTKVFYDRKGRLVASVKSYSEDNLPKEVRHLVKSNYYDYNIFHVQEVTAGNKTAYLVKIEDKTSIKTIRVTDNQMDEYMAFNKVNSAKR